MNRHARWTFVFVGLSVCLAFGLRIFQLGTQELRGDEAFDAIFASQAVPEILAQLKTEQPYPPLFHLGLHYWFGLAGNNEISQRLPAMVAGVLLVPLIYQLARLLLGRTTALLAAALAAINPFYIWHAQDGRMYSLLAALSVASTFLGLLVLQGRPRSRVGFAYWAVTILALLTHYFAWWVLLAENVVAVLIIWKADQRRARLGRWLLWQAAIILPVLPWLVFARGLLGSHTSGWIQALTPLEILRRSLITFSLGLTPKPALALPFSLIFGLLFGIGCFASAQKDRSSFPIDGRILLLISAGVPVLATVLLSLKRPSFDEKYLISVVAFYLVLVAHGLYALLQRAKVLGVVASLFMVVAAGWSLGNYYFNPEYAKSPPWRALVASIQDRAQEGDVVVYNYPDPGLNYYYRGTLPLRLLPARASLDPEQEGQNLRDLVASYRRVWLIPTPGSNWDPKGFVKEWLMRHCDLVDERSIGSLQLELYETQQTFLERMQPVHATLGGQIELLGYRLTKVGDAPLGPGARLSLTLYWQALRSVDSDFAAFVHLSDPDERIWGQDDGPPVNGTYPTTAWLPGEVVVDHRTVDISPDAPHGSYRLMTGMYDPITAQRLVVTGSADVETDSRILLAEIELDGR